MFILLIATVSVSAENVDNRHKIIVIDSGVDFLHEGLWRYRCFSGHYNYINDGTSPEVDELFHGTQVAELIVQDLNPEQVCLISFKIYAERRHASRSQYLAAHEGMREHKPILVNHSGGGEYMPDEIPFIKQILEQGSYFTVPGGNTKVSLDNKCIYFPACLKGMGPKFYPVGANDVPWLSKGSFLYYESGYSKHGAIGSSFAAPRRANRLLKELGFGLRP